jgi:hypothetical protein
VEQPALLVQQQRLQQVAHLLGVGDDAVAQGLAPVALAAARSHVMRYYERENGNWDRIKETEVEISLVKPEYIRAMKPIKTS